jgi:acetyl esterase
MALNPDLERVVRAFDADGTSPHGGELGDRRRRYRGISGAFWPQPDTEVSARDLVIGVQPPLPARHYAGTTDGSTTLLVFFHGGSFVLGDLESHDAMCRHLVATTGMDLIAIQYRLAPEWPFPSAVDDAVGVARYVSAHVGEVCPAAMRLVLIGDSAGAALAAAASALTRNEGLRVAAQVLLYPTAGPAIVTRSAHEYGRHALLDVEQLRLDYAQYLGAADATDPRASLLTAEDLRAAPPTVLVVAEFDPLRDEGVAYAALLQHFGVPVRLLEAEGMVHGFLRLGSVPAVHTVYERLAQELRATLVGA